MKLNLEIISDYLPKSYQVKLFGTENKSLYLKRPQLYESGCDFEKDRLYVARGDTLPKTPPKKGLAVVCVDLRPPHEWVSGGCQLLLIPNAPSLFAVFNEINKIYDKFEEWDNSLRNELEADVVRFDLKTLIKTGILLLENPISVTNRAMLVIFSSEIIRDDNGFEVRVSNDCLPMPMKESEMIKNVCNIERVITVPYLSSYTEGGIQSYCNNLYPFGYFGGCVSISNLHRPFRESDYPLADYFLVAFKRRLLNTYGVCALSNCRVLLQ